MGHGPWQLGDVGGQLGAWDVGHVSWAMWEVGCGGWVMWGMGRNSSVTLNGWENHNVESGGWVTHMGDAEVVAVCRIVGSILESSNSSSRSMSNTILFLQRLSGTLPDVLFCPEEA